MEVVNWLTHAKSLHWNDAEAGIAVTENAIALLTSAVIRHVRGVSELCPDCGSDRLSPERGYRDALPAVEWERTVCAVGPARPSPSTRSPLRLASLRPRPRDRASVRRSRIEPDTTPGSAQLDVTAIWPPSVNAGVTQHERRRTKRDTPTWPMQHTTARFTEDVVHSLRMIAGGTRTMRATRGTPRRLPTRPLSLRRR